MGRGIKQRSRWDIIGDILKGISEEERARKTRIMQRANLDWRSFKRYFDPLVERGFVEGGGEPHERGIYELTEKGKDLLMKLQELKEMLQTSSTEYIEDDDLGIEGKGKEKGEGKGDNANI
jgi:predicted transcriptional regulator